MKKILSKGHTRGSRWIALPVLALAVLLSIVVAWCMEPPAENAELMYVFVDNDDQVHIIDREHQIAYETESLQFHTDTSAADLQILLRKKENVTITKDGETFTAAARRETVENLLRRMDLEPDAGEMVALSVQDDGVHVDIVRDFYHDWNTEAVVPYETERRANPLLAKGSERVVQEGSDAVVTETYRDTYENGVIVSTDLVGTTDEAPVTEIVEYGTMVTSVSRDDRISSVHYNDDGQDGYLTFVSGDTMAFSYKTICNATNKNTENISYSKMYPLWFFFCFL